MKNNIKVIPGRDQVKIEINELKKLLGYNQGQSVDDKINAALEEQIENASVISSLKGIYSIFPLDEITNQCIRIQGQDLKIGQIIQTLKHCTEVAIFVITIGPQLSDEVKKLKEKDILASVILDTCGSILAENSADFLEEEIKKQVSALNMDITDRYSPGYCSWKLHDQRIIFNIIDAASIGVMINDDCFMTPKKSVSGIIGIGDKDIISNIELLCNNCQRENCAHRRS